jgi:hypothetical protein
MLYQKEKDALSDVTHSRAKLNSIST